MQGGKIAHWELLELQVNASASVSSTGSTYKVTGYGGNLTSEYTPTPTETATAMLLSVNSTNDPDNIFTGSLTQWTIRIPGVINKTVSVASYSASASTKAEFDNFRVYALNGAVWKVKWSELRWYRDGVLDTTIGNTELLGTIFTPAGIPILGIPPTINASASVNPEAAIGVVPSGLIYDDYEWIVYTTATGGWRFKAYEEDTTALPVDITRASIPGVPPPCLCTPIIGTTEATSTWDATATAYAREQFAKGEVTRYVCDDCTNGAASPPFEIDVWNASMEVESRGGSVMLLPNLTKAVERMNPADYKALIVRGGFPFAKSQGTSSCQYDLLSEGSSSVTETVIHPSHTEMLSTVGTNTHIIEDPLALESFAPYTEGGSIWTATKTQTLLVNPGACPASDPEDPPGEMIPCYPVIDTFCSTSLNGTYPIVEDEDTNTYLLPHLYHPDQTARYINYNANQHWSYLYFFAADGDTELWKVYDEKVLSDEYWVPIRTQYLEHPDLPAEERVKTRNSLVSAPLMEGCYSQWIVDNVIENAQSSFWGIHRFKAQTVVPEEYKQLDAQSSSSWEFGNCTANFLSDGIELTPVDGATQIACIFNIGSFEHEPYMYPHLADRIYIDWFDSNIVGVRAALVNIVNGSIVLGTNKGLYYKPLTPIDNAYAGSWAQDFGNGVVTDTGTDTKPQGISAATLADAEGVHYYRLLNGRGASRIALLITLDDPEETVKIKYHKFYISDSDATVIQESGHHANMIYPKGVGTRYGQWSWLKTSPNTELLVTPSVFPIGTPPVGWKSSVLDWLCYRKAVLEGIDRATDLASDIQTLYDNIELIGEDIEPSGNNQIYRECDSFTTSFIVQHGKAGTGILVNTAAEVPPVACFPWKTRGEDWLATGDYSQVAYSFAQEPRYYVNPNTAINLYDGATKWTEDVTAPEDWKITKHTHELTNNEVDFKIKREGDATNIYANVTPWHGYFANIALALAAKGLSYDSSDAGRHYLAYINEDSKVILKVADNMIPFTWEERDSLILAEAICVRVDRTSKNQELYLWYSVGGTVYACTSLNEGQNWDMPELIAPGNYPAFVISRSGVRYWYWVDGTTIKGQIGTPGTGIVVPTFDAITGIDEDTPIAVDESFGSNGQSRITIAYIQGGSVYTKTALDGQNFS